MFHKADIETTPGKASTGKCRPGEQAWAISIALLAFMFFSYAFSVISFYLGFPINGFIFPAAVTAGLFVSLILDSRPGVLRKISWMTTVVVEIGMSIFLANLVYDNSYDGLRYHQEIVSTLCDGWNPLRGANDPAAPEILWSLHYAKAVEIVEASIGCFTGRMEAGKAINIIMIIAAFSGVYAFLRANPSDIFFRGAASARPWSRKKSLWIALAIVGNPVVFSQWLIFYIDFYKYIYLLMVLLAFYLMKTSRGHAMKGYITLVMSLVLAMGTKFNFFFEAGVWMILALVWLMLKKDFKDLRRLFIASFFGLFIGTLLAFHPYITNLMAHGHPLYPLMGDGSVDIMTNNTTGKFLGHNRVVNFFISLFSLSLPNYDQREGGFSIMMPAILALSLVIAWKERTALRGVILYIAACLFASCFFFEQSWWARYICQLWGVGGLFLVASQCNHRVERMGKVMSGMMVAASLMAIVISSAVALMRGNYLRFLFEACRQEPVTVAGELPSQARRHLDEERVSYVRIEEVPADKTANALLYYFDCPTIIILSDAQIELIDKRLRLFHQSVDRYRYIPEEDGRDG